MNIRNFIINVLPHGLFIKMASKRQAEKNKMIMNSEGIVPEAKSSFQYILSLQGFGYSGHTALIDLLREFSPILVPTDITHKDTDEVYVKDGGFEYEIMRAAGGIVEMEKYITDSVNIIQNTAALQRMIKLLLGNPFLKKNDRCRNLTLAFIRSLVVVSLTDIERPFFNMHLFEYNYGIFYLKKMALKEYRRHAGNFLINICNEYYREGKRIILLDHLFSSLGLSEDAKRDYLPNIKTIVLYRDPRDVYSQIMMIQAEVVPRTPKEFVEWYRLQMQIFDTQKKECLLIGFEDLIVDYDNVVNNVMDYLNLDPSEHRYKFNCLDPKVSIKNVGLWRKFPERIEVYNYIYNELKPYCCEN